MFTKFIQAMQWIVARWYQRIRLFQADVTLGGAVQIAAGACALGLAVLYFCGLPYIWLQRFPIGQVVEYRVLTSYPEPPLKNGVAFFINSPNKGKGELCAKRVGGTLVLYSLSDVESLSKPYKFEIKFNTVPELRWGPSENDDDRHEDSDGMLKVGGLFAPESTSVLFKNFVFFLTPSTKKC